MDPQVGLCSNCLHCRLVQSARSTFYLCERSFADPEYRRYPALPVLACPGYDARLPGPGDDADHRSGRD
jgi:hypothetical protein